MLGPAEGLTGKIVQSLKRSMEEAGHWKSHPFWKQLKWTEERHLDQAKYGMHLLMVDSTWENEMW